MSTYISPQACVDPRAVIGANVYIGPFCLVGPNVVVGDHCRLDSHVVLEGHTFVGKNNRFWPNTVIGGEPQDYAYTPGTPTQVIIGDNNQFREGVTVNRGAEKEDGVTRIGNECLLMSNAHVAHNCYLGDKVMLVNGVLLGGHVHVYDRAIVSGNTVVHHFSTIGTLAFMSGGGRVTVDIPPYMMAAGNDDYAIRTVNVIGMQRAGISDEIVKVIRHAFKLLIRERKKLDEVKEIFHEQLQGQLPAELQTLFTALEKTAQGKMNRGREVMRNVPYSGQRKAA